MSRLDLRQRITQASAHLILAGKEDDLCQARRRAMKEIGLRLRHEELPTFREIRKELERVSSELSSAMVSIDVESMKLDILRLMRLLHDLDPRVVQPPGWDAAPLSWRTLIRVHTSDFEVITDRLRKEKYRFYTGRLRGSDQPPQDRYIPINVLLDYPIVIQVFEPEFRQHAWRDLGTGHMFASMPLEEFEQFMQDASGGDDLDLRLQGVELGESRYSIFHQLLEELDGVKLDGPDSQDALIHSLEMFDLACAEYGCDEEFLSAALLHRVGLPTDRNFYGEASAEVLQGLVTNRTLWLIRNLPLAHKYQNKTLSVKERRLLEEDENFDDLLALADYDRKANHRRAKVTRLEDAIHHLIDLDGE